MYNGTKKATPRVEKHILSVQDLTYTMVFMPGKENPADWSSRHPENIEDWSDYEKKKHGLDEGEEIRLNKIRAVRKVDKILEEAGITGGNRCAEDDIATAGRQDNSYRNTLALVANATVRTTKLMVNTSEWRRS